MARVKIKVIPKSGRRECKFDGDRLKVWLKASPEAGRANEELVRILAKLLKIPRADISIVSGSTSRNKAVDIEGISVNELRQKIEKSA